MADEVIVRTAYDVLNKYGEGLVDALGKNLTRTNFHGFSNRASGKLSKSIHFHVLQMPQSQTFELYMADYWQWVDKGRNPTRSGYGDTVKGAPLDWAKPSLRKSILQWMTDKGITPTLKGKAPKTLSSLGIHSHRAAGQIAVGSYLFEARSMAVRIARKIHRYGYVGSGFFSDAMKKGQAGDVEQLEKDLMTVLGRAVKVSIITDLNTNN